MARARLIKPGFFTNEALAERSMAARLLFAGLWTIADREGRLEDRPKRIRAELFPYEADLDVDALLAELEAGGFIERYTAKGMALITIPAFAKHQHIHPREPKGTLPGPDHASSGPDTNEPGKARAGPGQARAFPGEAGTDPSEAEAEAEAEAEGVSSETEAEAVSAHPMRVPPPPAIREDQVDEFFPGDDVPPGFERDQGFAERLEMLLMHFNRRSQQDRKLLEELSEVAEAFTADEIARMLALNRIRNPGRPPWPSQLRELAREACEPEAVYASPAHD